MSRLAFEPSSCANWARTTARQDVEDTLTNEGRDVISQPPRHGASPHKQPTLDVLLDAAACQIRRGNEGEISIRNNKLGV